MIKRRLLELLADAKRYIWQQVLWKWLALVCQIVIALTAARLIQSALDSAITVSGLLASLVVVTCGLALRVVCDRNEVRTAHLASVDVKRVLRGKVYNKLLRLGTSYRESVGTSKVVQLAVEGVEQLETYFSLFIAQFVYAFLAPLTLFAVLGPAVSWKIAAMLLVFVPLIPASIALTQVIAKRILSKYWGQYTKLGDTFLENLQGLTTLKVYQADEQATAYMDADSEKLRVATMNVLKMQLTSTAVMDIGAYGGAAIGIVVALGQAYAGNISLGGLVAFVLLAAEFFLPMRRLGSYFHVGMNGMAASDNIFALLDLPERDASQAQALPDSLWTAGVSAYTDGDWALARNAWEQLRALGLESPQLYCNLGDACFKQDDLAHAILNYERALKLDPSFADARHNLSFAQGLVQDKIEAVPEFFLEQWGRKACWLLPSDTWSVLFLIFLAVTLGCGLLFLLGGRSGLRKTGFIAGIVALLLTLLCLDFAFWQRTDYRKADGAIVTLPVVTVQSAPGRDSAKDLFVLHEGTKVKLLDAVGTWRNIELADGRQGWLEEKDLEVI